MSSAEVSARIEELNREKAEMSGKKAVVVDALREKTGLTLEEESTTADVLNAANRTIEAAQNQHAELANDLSSIEPSIAFSDIGRNEALADMEQQVLERRNLLRMSESLDVRVNLRRQKYADQLDARNQFVQEQVKGFRNGMKNLWGKVRGKEAPDYFKSREAQLRDEAREKGVSEDHVETWVKRRLAAERIALDHYDDAANAVSKSRIEQKVTDVEQRQRQVESSLLGIGNERVLLEQRLAEVKGREGSVQQSTQLASELQSLLQQQAQLDERESSIEVELAQANKQLSEELDRELHAEGFVFDLAGKKQETLFKLGTEAVYKTAFDARVDANGEPRDPVDVITHAAEGVGAYLEYYRRMKEEAEGIEQGREIASRVIEEEITSAVEGLIIDKHEEFYKQEDVLSKENLERSLSEQKALWSAQLDLPKLKYLMDISKNDKRGEKAKLAYQRAQEKVEQKLQKIRDTQDAAVQRAESRLQKWMTTELPKQIDTHRKLKMKEYVDSMLADLPLGDRKRVTEIAYDVALSEAETAMASLEKWKMLLENPERLKQKIVDALAEQQASIDVAAEYLEALYGGVAGIEDRIKDIRAEQRRLKNAKGEGRKNDREAKVARLELERLGLVDQKEDLMREVREVEEEVRKNKLGGRGMLNKLLRQYLPPELFGEKAYPDNGDTQVAELYKYVAYGQPAPDFAQEANDAPTRHHLQLDSFFDQVAPSLDSLKADITGAVTGRTEALKSEKQAEMAQRAAEARETLIGSLDEQLIEIGNQSWESILGVVNKASSEQLAALSKEAVEVILGYSDRLAARVALIVQEIGELPEEADETALSVKIDALSRIDVIIKRGASTGASTRLDDLSARITQTIEALKKPEESAPEPEVAA